MSNHNVTQCGTQVTGLGVMIERCTMIANMGHPVVILRMLTALFFFKYINDDVINHNQRPTLKTWTGEDNQLALQCYFRSKTSHRGYRKRMINIWQECAKFQTTSQRLADQVRTIIKKGLFSDLELLEIHQKTHKQNYNTAPDTSSGVKKRQSNGKELQTSANTHKRYTSKQPGINTITRKRYKSRKCK